MCDCEDPEFFYSATRKARRNHECCECTLIIPSGMNYAYSSGKSDGQMWSFKSHTECLELADKIASLMDCCHLFTGLLDEIEEYLDNHYIDFGKLYDKPVLTCENRKDYIIATLEFVKFFMENDNV